MEGRKRRHRVCIKINSIFCFFLFLDIICVIYRQIQDPASQRLTWYKPPLAVLVIKKVRDQLVLPPFIQLVEWLIQVGLDFIFKQNLC